MYNKDICWNIPGKGKTLYLTFDDGPHPVATPYILDFLKQYNIKATFFCIGKNVEEYPNIYQRIIDEEHTVGNHTYSHRSGWKIPVDEYMEDVKKSAEIIQSSLFRPPYGRITPIQFKVLKHHYKIVMWDVLSKDYDENVTNEEVIDNVTHHIGDGSIIVMHDNDKTVDRLPNILPEIISTLLKDGWKFGIIS